MPAVNLGSANVEVIPAAIGAEPGEAGFAVSDAGVDARAGVATKSDRKMRVPVTTIDAFVHERGLDRLDFVKADIEGSEEPALRGGVRALRRLRPKLSFASYHTDPHGDPQHSKLARGLRDVGYRTKELRRKHIYAWPVSPGDGGLELETETP